MTTEHYEVARHHLTFHFADGLDGATILPSFQPFIADACADALVDMTVERGTAPDFSDMEEIGQFDCGGANHGVYRTADMQTYAFEISLPTCDGGEMCCCLIAEKAFSRCRAVLLSDAVHRQTFGLNNGMMMAYAFAAAQTDTLLMHASVIRHKGYGYLFTAPSGTGKSTHTYLWYKNIPGCDLMNDDNPVVRIIDGKTIIFGSPWSGKTPCYRNINAPVGAVTRIEQKPVNTIRPMKPLEAFAMLLPAVSSMKWDGRVYTGICAAISRLLGNTPVYLLGCRPDAEAAHVCHDAIAVS